MCDNSSKPLCLIVLLRLTASEVFVTSQHKSRARIKRHSTETAKKEQLMQKIHDLTLTKLSSVCSWKLYRDGKVWWKCNKAPLTWNYMCTSKQSIPVLMIIGQMVTSKKKSLHYLQTKDKVAASATSKWNGSSGTTKKTGCSSMQSAENSTC